MAVRSLFAALGFFAVAVSAAASEAQMTGYPNNGGRIPGTVASGPQFPGVSGAVIPTSGTVGYGGQQIYPAPPLKAYTPSPGNDPLTGAPAVSYGTPIASPPIQNVAQPAPSAAPSGPQALPLSTPIATPAVSAPVAGVPTLAPPLNGPSLSAQPSGMPQSNFAAPRPAPVSVTQAPSSYAPPSGPVMAPAVPTIVGASTNGSSSAATTAAAPVGSNGYMAGPYSAYNAPSAYAPPAPDYSTPPAYPQYTPNAGAVPAEMPVGRLTQQEISPYAHGSAPPKYTSWLPRIWKPAAAPLFDNTPANSNYGAVYPNESSTAQSGEPSAPYYPGENCGPGVPLACTAQQEPWFTNFAAISTLDAFKTPMDLDGLNANFGKRIGAIGSFPIWREMGLGGQVSSTAAWYDWKGSQFTGHDVRFQNFNSVGLFARSASTGLGFGIAHDWLYDDYYAKFHLSQFRVAASWEVNCNNEVGLWCALPQRRDSAFIGTPAVNNQFQSLVQGNLYWKHYWSDYAWTSTYAGLAESPSDISYGANVQVAVTRFIAVTGAATYVVPGSGGSQGRQEEIWNLSFGFLFYPGTAMAAQRSQFRPMFAPADPGNFATWRR